MTDALIRDLDLPTFTALIQADIDSGIPYDLEIVAGLLVLGLVSQAQVYRDMYAKERLRKYSTYGKV